MQLLQGTRLQGQGLNAPPPCTGRRAGVSQETLRGQSWAGEGALFGYEVTHLEPTQDSWIFEQSEGGATLGVGKLQQPVCILNRKAVYTFLETLFFFFFFLSLYNTASMEIGEPR